MRNYNLEWFAAVLNDTGVRHGGVFLCATHILRLDFQAAAWISALFQ
jgi:hypothetical protein